LRDDASDHEGDQDDDRQATQRDQLHLVDKGGRAEVPSPSYEARRSDHHLAEKAQSDHQVGSSAGHALADIDQGSGRVIAALAAHDVKAMRLDLAQEGRVPRLDLDDIGLLSAGSQITERAVDDPGSNGVEPLDRSEIDDYRHLSVGAVEHRGQAAFDRGRLVGGPMPRQCHTQLPFLPPDCCSGRVRGRELRGLNRHV
jgi:hypothetical protein